MLWEDCWEVDSGMSEMWDSRESKTAPAGRSAQLHEIVTTAHSAPISALKG